MPRWPKQTTKERFYSHVKKLPGRNACWEYQGALDGFGYRNFKLNGKVISAHHVVWILESKEAIGDQQVLHHCDNPRCVRIKHLYLGT